MKKPEEIKKAFECCAEFYKRCGKECPYYRNGCLNALTVDAATLFGQMEAELAQVKKERDTLKADMEFIVYQTGVEVAEDE